MLQLSARRLVPWIDPSMTHRDPELDLERRAAVAALVERAQRRLRARHWFVLVVALLVVTGCGVGVAGSFWGYAARQLAASRHTLRELLPLFVVGYICAGLLAAWAWARFDLRRAVLRAPVVLAFGAVGILLLLGSHFVHLAGADAQGGDARDDRDMSSEPQPPPTTLAGTLVDHDEATAMLGVPVGPPIVHARRRASTCRYTACDRSATLEVMVRQVPRRMGAEQLFRRGDPLPGLGDAAATVDGGVWVLSGEWFLALQVSRRDGRPADKTRLIEGARRALDLLRFSISEQWRARVTKT
jgi:hypothetical protein